MVWVLALFAALWWPFGVVLLHNLRTLPRLRDLPAPPPDAELPSVTVIAPACNEDETLAAAMNHRLEGAEANLHVLIVDDRSTDDTGAIADRLAADDPRVSVLHLTELPEGWLGKVHALARGAAEVETDFILFSDADVEVGPGVLSRCLFHCEREGLDVLAAMPTMRPGNGILGSLYAEFLRVLYAAFRTSAVEDPESRYGLGVGAFTLVRREALEASPGFAVFRMEVADDLMLGRMLKASGARCSLLDIAGDAAVNIYPTVGSFVRGAEKNAWGVSANFSLVRGLVTVVALLCLDLGPLLLFALAGLTPLGLFGLASHLWATTLAAIALAYNRQPAWPALLYPVGSLVFAWAAFRGTLKGWRAGGLVWRGTFYPTEAFLAARRDGPPEG